MNNMAQSMMKMGRSQGLAKQKESGGVEERAQSRSALKALRRHRQQEIRDQFHTRPNW